MDQLRYIFSDLSSIKPFVAYIKSKGDNAQIDVVKNDTMYHSECGFIVFEYNGSKIDLFITNAPLKEFKKATSLWRELTNDNPYVILADYSQEKMSFFDELKQHFNGLFRNDRVEHEYTVCNPNGISSHKELTPIELNLE